MKGLSTSRLSKFVLAALIIVTGPEAIRLAWGLIVLSLNLVNKPGYMNAILEGHIAMFLTGAMLAFCIFWASAIVWCSVIPAWVDKVAVIVGSGIAILAVVEVVLSFHEVASPWRLVGINGLLAAYFAVTSWMIHSANVNRDKGRSPREDPRLTHVVE